MSQQINLLVQQDGKRASIVPRVALVLGVLFVVLLGYWGSEHYQTMKMEGVFLQGEQHLREERVALLKGHHADPMGKQGAEANDIDQLRARAEMSQAALNLAQKGELGSATGYLGHFSALAKISSKDLWLTSVTIGNGGKDVHIDGRALSKESVLRYAQQLNQTFSPLGVRFNSVEITPEILRREGGVPPLPTVAFRLF